MRETDGDGAALRSILAGLLPGLPVEGLPEVIAWIRDTRDGSVVVRGRLERAAQIASSAATAIGDLDIRALSVELAATHQALTAAVATHPEGSFCAIDSTISIGATDPAPDLGLVLLNVDRVKAAFAAAASTIAPTTAADRSEVQITATGLGAAFAPLSPVVDKVNALASFAGIDPVVLAGPSGPRLAMVGLLERIGPEPIIGMLRSMLTRLAGRLAELVHDGLVAPLRSAVDELVGLLDALSIQPVVDHFNAVRDRMTALVDGLRPAVVLATPLAALESLRTTLTTFDPMGPVRTVVDALKAEITAFARTSPRPSCSLRS